MNVTSFVREGLGNSSYLVDVGRGEAVLVDPDRLVDRYFAEAARKQLKIVAVLDTHVHADFVSGALEALALTDLTLFAPREGGYRFKVEGVGDGQSLKLGSSSLRAIATPGHTPEHLSYVLEVAGAPPAIFSGGALLVGGAARTDLIDPALTESLTRAQHRSLNTAYAALPAESRVLPTHGGGSFCSAGGGTRRTSTLGEERANNPAMGIPDEEEFVRWFPTTFTSAPAYYFEMRTLNQAGAALRRDIPMPARLTPEEFLAASKSAWVIDARPVRDYAAAHISGSVSIPFRDGFGVWVGSLVPTGARLLFVPGRSPIEALVDECQLVGYDAAVGYLDGGISAWKAAGLPVKATPLIDASNAREAASGDAVVIDVREASEFAAGHLKQARFLPVITLPGRLSEVPRDRRVIVQCEHGLRSASAASLLERAGIEHVSIVAGGPEIWRKAGLPQASGLATTS